VGVKPIESGVESPEISDAARLHAVSAWATAEPPYALRAPVSPHRAASMEGREIDWQVVREYVADTGADEVLVELPGGLFTPCTLEGSNADLVQVLGARRVVLVAQARLGVFHEVTSTLLASHAVPGPWLWSAVVLTPPASDKPVSEEVSADLSAILGARGFAVPVLSAEWGPKDSPAWTTAGDALWTILADDVSRETRST
jgi:dethiobiotin synthetase